MERRRPPQNSQRPKLKMKQSVGMDSISDNQQYRTTNPQINAKSLSSSQPHSPPLPLALPPNVPGNVDKVLYDDLVEIVPLIETLMVRFFLNLLSIFLYIYPVIHLHFLLQDQRGNSAYKRSAQMISTPNPTQQKKVFHFFI